MPRYLVNSEIIAAMAAMRTYPAADVAQESALFWRILLNSRGTAMRWVVELRLRDASTLVRPCFLHGLNMQPACTFIALR